MKKATITRAALGRLPMYLEYVRSHAGEATLSASEMARELGLGEVLVRKDINLVCGVGRPKVGYQTMHLLADLEAALGRNEPDPAVIVGVGRLGLALLRYKGFERYGVKVIAGFDCDEEKVSKLGTEYPILPMSMFESYCREHKVRIGIITVPMAVAQTVCDAMICSGVRAIWNFSSYTLKVPEDIVVKNENLALSVAHLRMLID